MLQGFNFVLWRDLITRTTSRLSVLSTCLLRLSILFSERLLESFFCKYQYVMKRLLAFIVGGLMICSCEPVTSEIGADFFSDGMLDYSYADSVTVKLSTIQLEEMVTNSTSRMLVGTHRDESLGRFTATPYFQVAPSGDVNFEDQNFTYDHISLVLPLDHYSYYDTLLPLKLNVYRVKEDIKTESGYLYNSSSFQFKVESIGSITFKPRPHQDSLEIKLSDVLGEEIFSKAMNGSEELVPENFSRYIQGIAIVPDTFSSACILGLTTNPKLRVHYFDKSVTPVAKKHIEINVESRSGLYFSNIRCDRKNTNLETMPSTKDRLSSKQTNDKAFIQAGAGLALRVDIPYLRTLKEVANLYPIRAILEIYPVRKSYNTSTKLPAQLKVFKANKRNAIYEEIETMASLVEDQALGRDTHYSFDATQFVKEQMELQSLNENALIFTTDKTTYPVSAERIYAAAPGYEYKTRLRIYFATVNN